MEIGVHVIAGPGRAADTARFMEDLGFATLLFPDSQNLQPDVWGQLMVAARATSRVRLGPGVTNSVTRDAAVRAYLDGTPVDRDGTPSRLEWLPHIASAGLPRLPIEVAATGRRVIEVG